MMSNVQALPRKEKEKKLLASDRHRTRVELRIRSLPTSQGAMKTAMHTGNAWHGVHRSGGEESFFGFGVSRVQCTVRSTPSCMCPVLGFEKRGQTQEGWLQILMISF